ncbi:MAG TPA: response regulator [Candidatus Bilamarchaeum sp.]|nr:response regulator [Candidatus Bilamarchaeum sp.]
MLTNSHVPTTETTPKKFPERKPESEGIRRKSACVLIVDDDPDTREPLRIILELDGHTGKEAENGKEGLEAYRKGGIDFVISDLHMPVMNGLQMLEAIKAIDPEAKVVVCSGEGNDDEFDKLRKAGALAVFRKPADVDKIRELIERAVASQ